MNGSVSLKGRALVQQLAGQPNRRMSWESHSWILLQGGGCWTSAAAQSRRLDPLPGEQQALFLDRKPGAARMDEHHVQPVVRVAEVLHCPGAGPQNSVAVWRSGVNSGKRDISL